jgi:hypothetical protein
MVLSAAMATRAQVIVRNIVCLLLLPGRSFAPLFVEESPQEVRACAARDPRNECFVTGITVRSTGDYFRRSARTFSHAAIPAWA